MTPRRILATSGGMVAGPVQMTWRVGKMVLDALALTKKDRPRVCLVEKASGEAGQIYRVELDGTTTTTVTIEGGALLGLALDRDGFLYVCGPRNHQVWRITAESTYEPFGSAIDYPNYAAFGPDGRLFVSDSGSFDEATGQLLVIDADGATTNVTPRPIAFANGLCVDATTLWVVESSAPGVSAMALGGGPSNSSFPWSAASPTVWPLTPAEGSSSLVINRINSSAGRERRVFNCSSKTGPASTFSRPPTLLSTAKHWTGWRWRRCAATASSPFARRSPVSRCSTPFQLSEMT